MSASTPKTASFEGDNPVLGILLMVLFCMLIPFSDACLKLLGETVPVLTVIVVRFSLQFLFMGAIMLIRQRTIGHIFRLSSYIWWRLLIRAVMQISGIAFIYIGLMYMPLADTTAICFIYPILMLLVGHVVMKEVVGPHRIMAALVGFAGTLMVVQPNFMEVGLNALWPVGVAFTFVIFMLATRQTSRGIDPVTVQVLSAVIALVIVAVPILLLNGDGFEAFDLKSPSREEWLFLVGAGVIGSLGHLLMTAAVHLAPSATLAPMQYLEIPFATFIGWLIFSDLPNSLAAWGIAVTVAAGLYIIYREQKALNESRRQSAIELPAEEII
ncbi:EamA domain-containing membrane protein RarD [Cohaesibacter marisflavi]|uniref:EamA domain-containing membrane protein RarD n=1 Tax=Cohaesibacter marisflavi TaxID=655353 RepID=A0A1I5EN19_9HYPH|nr:DMT family transporter [Cohaesibacter marisflavi]SFO12868.1 EamA domain-containing membrane protein RarD [Cohaesibacter marisflavi]